MVLESVPEKFKTAELCLEAVKYNIDAFQYIPEEFKKVVELAAEEAGKVL
jgi:hypothetical protein